VARIEENAIEKTAGADLRVVPVIRGDCREEAARFEVLDAGAAKMKAISTLARALRMLFGPTKI
jgi:hypothetical protein